MSWTTPITWTTGQVVTAANLNTHIRDNENFLYGDTSWTAPTFANSWVDFGSPYPAAGFRLIGTRVVMTGAIKSGTLGVAAFTLPTGYRPTGQVKAPSFSGNAAVYILISAAGAVIPEVGPATEMTLSAVNFDTI